MRVRTKKISEKNENYELLCDIFERYVNGEFGIEKNHSYWEIVVGSKINKSLEKNYFADGEFKHVNFSDEEFRKRSEEKRMLSKFDNKGVIEESTSKVEAIKNILKAEINKIFRKFLAKLVSLSKKKKEKSEDKIEEKEARTKIEKIDSEVLVFGEKINFHEGTVEKIADACDLQVQWGELEDFDDRHEPHLEEELQLPRGTGKVDDIVVELLEKELGDRFVGEYLRAKRTVETVVERWPSVILDAFPGDDLVQRVLVAEAVERGATLVGVQHGGWYGEIGYYGLEWIEKKISDVFATWGYQNSEIDVGMPAPKLMNDRSTKPGGETLLWLSRSVDHWGDYLSPATFFDTIDGVNGPNEGQARFERALELYNALRQRTRSNLLLRFDYKHLPDTEGHMRMLKWRIDRQFNEANIDRGGKGLESRIRDARLILVDHVPSTVFAECIHSGVPTILIDKIDDKWLTDNARQAYRDLEEAGVLYQEPDAAARKIEEIYDDPLDWWTSEEVLGAVNRYREEFAYVGERPVEEWATFLEELHTERTR